LIASGRVPKTDKIFTAIVDIPHSDGAAPDLIGAMSEA
jgi:hypothetical protein